MARVECYLPAELKDKLSKRAAEEGMTLSHFLKIIVDKFFHDESQSASSHVKTHAMLRQILLSSYDKYLSEKNVEAVDTLLKEVDKAMGLGD